MHRFANATLATVLAVLIAVPAFAGSDETLKVETNKTIRMLGFSPIAGTAASLAETEPNDDCGTADASPIGNDIAASIGAAGDEDWFAFDAFAGECVTLATESRESSTTDTQLYLYDAAGCGDPLAWIAFNDDGGPGLFSLLEDFEIPADGTYYVRIKHYSATGTGDYTLVGSSGACAQPPANDTCDNAIVVACNSTVSGTTTAAANDLEDLAETCVPFGADGPDVFYEVVVAAGDQIDVMLTPTDWDPALWIVADCNDENSCLAGADTGFFNDPEMVSWLNDTGSDQTVYIVPDGYFSGAFGDFDLTISCDAVVSDDASTWGAVKSRF